MYNTMQSNNNYSCISDNSHTINVDNYDSKATLPHKLKTQHENLPLFFNIGYKNVRPNKFGLRSMEREKAEELLQKTTEW